MLVSSLLLLVVYFYSLIILWWYLLVSPPCHSSDILVCLHLTYAFSILIFAHIFCKLFSYPCIGVLCKRFFRLLLFFLYNFMLIWSYFSNILSLIILMFRRLYLWSSKSLIFSAILSYASGNFDKMWLIISILSISKFNFSTPPLINSTSVIQYLRYLVTQSGYLFGNFFCIFVLEDPAVWSNLFEIFSHALLLYHFLYFFILQKYGNRSCLLGVLSVHFKLFN